MPSHILTGEIDIFGMYENVNNEFDIVTVSKVEGDKVYLTRRTDPVDSWMPERKFRKNYKVWSK